MLSQSSDLDEILYNIANLAIPELGDWSSIDYRSPDGRLKRIVAVKGGPKLQELAKELSINAPSGTSSMNHLFSIEPIQTTSHTIENITPEKIETFPGPQQYKDVLKKLGVHTTQLVPLRTSRGEVGMMAFSLTDPKRKRTAEEKALAEQLAQRCALAIENEQLNHDVKSALYEREQSLTLLSAIESESPIGIGFFDTELCFQRANTALASFFKMGTSAILGQRIAELSDDFKPYEQQLQEIASGNHVGIEVDFSSNSLGPDHIDHIAEGAETYWNAHFYPVRNPSGAVIGVGLILLDITGKMRAEEARRRSDEQLMLALDATRMGLWYWDVHTGAIRLSETNAVLLGLDPLKTDLTVDDFYKAIHPEDVERVRTAVAHSFETGQLYEETFRVRLPNNQIRWLMGKGRIQESEFPGRFVMIGVQLDVTENQVAQDEKSRLAVRQTRAGEQAVRMQRVTAALSEALTVSQVCDVVLQEGCAVVGAPRGIVSLLSDDKQIIETTRISGYANTKDPINFITLDSNIPITETLKTGNTILVTSQEDLASRYPDAIEVTTATQTEAFACVPLLNNGHVLGCWTIAWPEAREFEEGELIILLTLANQAGQAIDRARMYERERLIATALQRTLLPARLPSLPGAVTAWRYSPSSAGVEVGGDWYDVIRLPENRVGLVIGDVGGHNIDAAAVMGQLRNAIRSYAWEGHSASTVLEATSRLLCGLEPGALATCCYIEFNLDDGIAAIARAGHPPPLLVSGDEANYANIPADPPLGTDPTQKFEQSTLFFTPGDCLVLFTDGLVETRTVSLSYGMQRLAAISTGIAKQAAENDTDIDPEDLADSILTSLAPQEEREDDIALLILRYEPPQSPASHAGPRIVKRHLPSSATSAGVARRFAADVLDDWGAPELADLVSLCVSELVTNALIHTATDVELILQLSPTSARVEVLDHSDRMPIMREGSEEDTSGRGLQIVDAVSSSWGVDPYQSGKSVWFQIDRPLAANLA